MDKKTSDILTKLWSDYFILLLIFALIAFKVSWLTLPFYWDEAWSYAMAIFDMANSGPTIIPGHANEWLTRGHPLFFYFIASSWLVIFGKTVFSAHLFALLISCGSLFIIHFSCKKMISIPVANIVALALMTQAMFLAQSTLLLPEIFLMGLTFWVFYLYFQKKWWLYILVSFCLILSKETALVLFSVLFFDKILLQKIIYQNECKYNMIFFKEFFFVIIPFLFFGVFLFIQKLNLGYFFFPEHTQMMSFVFSDFLNKLFSISAVLFIRNARLIWLIIGIAALLFGIIKKRFSKKDVHLFIVSSVFIIGYLVFSSLNFFTTRYLLTLLPFFLLLSTIFVVRSFSKKIRIALFVIVISGTLYYSLVYNNGEADVNLTLNQTIMAHKEAVNFCELQQWHDKTIDTWFLMGFNLKFPHLGYLNNKEKPFSKFSNDLFPDVFIFYSIERDSRIDEIKNDANYKLVKQITKPNGCNVEIYEKVLVQD